MASKGPQRKCLAVATGGRIRSSSRGMKRDRDSGDLSLGPVEKGTPKSTESASERQELDQRASVLQSLPCDLHDLVRVLRLGGYTILIL